MIPNNHDENAGVRCRASISPSFGGNARWIASDSAVRAAGRIVVWQLAAAELRIASRQVVGELNHDDFRNRSDLAEVGAKFSLLDHKLFAAVTLFDQRRTQLALEKCGSCRGVGTL